MVHVQKGICFDLSLMLCTIFKVCRRFFGNGDFEKFVKNSLLRNFNFFSVFQSDAPRCSHACKELVEKFVIERFFSKKAF